MLPTAFQLSRVQDSAVFVFLESRDGVAWEMQGVRAPEPIVAVLPCQLKF